MRRYLLLLCTTVLVLPLSAQWRVVATHGIGAGYNDARDESAPDTPEFHADRLRTWTFGLGHQHAGWRLGVEARRTVADLTEDSNGSAVAVRNALVGWGVTAQAARRMAGHDGVASLWADLGVGADRWTFEVTDQTPAWRLVARAALEVGVPISRHLSGVVRGDLSVGGAAFQEEDLPEGFVTHTPRRISLFLGLALTR